MKVLVTGSCGLIGSEAVQYYDSRADWVAGIDNNMRAEFFGTDGDTTWMQKRLQADCSRYQHIAADIRDREEIARIVAEIKPDLIIHCAAQPSHDLAVQIPFKDFEVNATGTLNLLEATRQAVPESVFVFMSTNKVYGDAPNSIKLKELETRWDYDDARYANGIAESFTIDQSKHSLFGASKVAADVLVQEYGRYFGMKTGIFRGGCLTGNSHSSVELHGFLSYFFKAAVGNRRYTIYGYQGKQVRDQIHSVDVIRAFDAFYQNPQCGAVYNLGGGKDNSVSILECIDRVEQLLGKKIDYTYSDENRIGDHICYYTDLTKMKTDFPDWSLTYSLDDIFDEFAENCIKNKQKLEKAVAG
ncbi:NAD-dependent epimerase/dehydratase family protein [Planctomycetota bacterium]